MLISSAFEKVEKKIPKRHETAQKIKIKSVL
jgi:hypothetical protein